MNKKSRGLRLHPAPLSPESERISGLPVPTAKGGGFSQTTTQDPPETPEVFCSKTLVPRITAVKYCLSQTMTSQQPGNEGRCPYPHSQRKIGGRRQASREAANRKFSDYVVSSRAHGVERRAGAKVWSEEINGDLWLMMSQYHYYMHRDVNLSRLSD